MPKKLNAFSWYGGKYSHLNWLLPLLDTPCTHFVDVFGGSAAVLLNREPSPVETYNDLDWGVVNFYHCLRQYPSHLTEILGHTPYSRAEFKNACEVLKEVGEYPGIAEQSDQLEWARLFFIRSRMAYSGMGQKATGRNWSYDHDRSRRGMSGSVSRWHACIDDLGAISNRFLRVQIERDDAFNLIKRLDRSGVLFYCDPPYIHRTRNGHRDCYVYEMTDEQHIKLAKQLNSCRAKVAISYYDCELLNELYPPGNGKWERHYAPKQKIRSGKRITQEMLITNYFTKEEQ